MANVGLVAMSAYLISRAQTATNVAELALAITAVRVLAIARSVARYIERIVIHAGTFRVLADLRSWFFRSIEPLAPAGLPDLAERRPARPDHRRHRHARGGVRRRGVPPIAAAAAVTFGCVLLGWIEPIAGWVLLAFAVAAGLVLPVDRALASRARARERIATRALATAFALDGVRGVADLAAFDRDEAHRARLLRTADALDGATSRLATIRAAPRAGPRW